MLGAMCAAPDHRVSRSAAGGAAGETGSTYRSAVGAYLMAHGLAGRQPGLFPDAGLGYPIAIAVEADEAVDDLVCDLSEGGRLLFQAKRRFGLDDKLRSAVAQWVEITKTGQLRTGDLLVVIGSDLTGRALALRAALDRARQRIAQTSNRAEASALRWLNELVGPDLDDEQRRDLISRARIVHAPVDDVHSSLLREAASLLETTVVDPGGGRRAVDALDADVRRQAGRRYGSDLDNWLDILRTAEVPLMVDSSATPAARRLRVSAVVSEYLAQHARRLDRLDLPATLDDVPPLDVEDLLRDYQVQIEGVARETTPRRGAESLERLLVRWGRLCIQGLPGAGKSTVLNQIGAIWAAAPGALPTPVKISLRALADATERVPGELSVHEMVARCAEFVPGATDRELLASELVSRLKNGTAGLLMDGLDECGAQRSVVVRHVERFLETSAQECPVVLTSRASTANIALRLDLPVVTLLEPPNLDANITALIEHVARARGVDDEAWVRERRDWVRRSKNEDRLLWSVPLLATLATILVCSPKLTKLPRNRAEILRGAIETSLSDWEATKHRPERRWSTGLTTGHLFFAFKVIGNCLIDDVTSAVDVAARLSRELESRWRMSGYEAVQVARDGIRFWDELAGVYVLNDGGDVLTSRTRLFAELADALWVDDLDDAQKHQWLERRSADPAALESVSLACYFAPSFVDWLVDLAKSRRSWWLLHRILDIVQSDVTSVSTRSAETLVDLLVEAITLCPSSLDRHEQALTGVARIALRHRDDTSWGWTVALCRVRMPEELRHRRDDIIAACVSADERALARALAAVSDAATDGHAWSSDTTRAIEDALLLDVPELPDDDSLAETSRRSFRLKNFPTLRTGHAELAASAAPHLKPLSEDVATALSRISELAPSGVGAVIRGALQRAGFGRLVKPWDLRHQFDLEGFAQRMDGEWAALTEALSAMDDSIGLNDLSLVERWRMPEYTAAIEILDIASLANGDLASALADVRLLTRAAKLMLASRGFDIARVAAHARAALEQIAESRRDVSLMACIPSAPGRERAPVLTGLATQDQAFAIDLVFGGSAYLALIGAKLIDEAKSTATLALYPGDLSTIRTDRKYLAALLYLNLQPERAYEISESWLRGNDSTLRQAGCDTVVRTALRIHRSPPDHPDSIAALLADPDWSIQATTARRLKDAGVQFTPPDPQSAKYWACSDCEFRNTPGELDCRNCPTGSRPHEVKADS